MNSSTTPTAEGLQRWTVALIFVWPGAWLGGGRYRLTLDSNLRSGTSHMSATVT